MSKQPYIPIYTGDYLKDTRTLPLNARGAWVDLMIFMWDSPKRGVICHTMIEYSQLMSCTLEEANFVIGLLQEKLICDSETSEKNQIKLICRRMVREAKISKKRSKAGKKGMESRYSEEEFCYNKTHNKSVTTSDNDIDNDIVIEVKEEEVQEKKPLETVAERIEEILQVALSDGYLDGEQPKWGHIDFRFELESFKNKVRGSPDEYRLRDTNGIRLAFQYQLRNAKSKSANGRQIAKDKSTQHVNNLMEGYKRRNGEIDQSG